jgi:flagellar biosynthesis/type III secretory pathway M-ring protein FliF/YscJ
MNMGKDIKQQVGDRKDNNRVLTWGIAAVVVLVVAALVFNTFFRSADPAPASTGTTQQPTPDPVGNQAPK